MRSRSSRVRRALLGFRRGLEAGVGVGVGVGWLPSVSKNFLFCAGSVQRHLVVKLAGKYPVKQFSDHFNGDAVAIYLHETVFHQAAVSVNDKLCPLRL